MSRKLRLKNKKCPPGDAGGLRPRFRFEGLKNLKKRPKMAKNSQKTAKNGQKRPKNAQKRPENGFFYDFRGNIGRNGTGCGEEIKNRTQPDTGAGNIISRRIGVIMAAV